MNTPLQAHSSSAATVARGCTCKLAAILRYILETVQDGAKVAAPT